MYFKLRPKMYLFLHDALVIESNNIECTKKSPKFTTIFVTTCQNTPSTHHISHNKINEAPLHHQEDTLWLFLTKGIKKDKFASHVPSSDMLIESYIALTLELTCSSNNNSILQKHY